MVSTARCKLLVHPPYPFCARCLALGAGGECGHASRGQDQRAQLVNRAVEHTVCFYVLYNKAYSNPNIY